MSLRNCWHSLKPHTTTLVRNRSTKLTLMHYLAMGGDDQEPHLVHQYHAPDHDSDYQHDDFDSLSETSYVPIERDTFRGGQSYLTELNLSPVRTALGFPEEDIRYSTSIVNQPSSGDQVSGQSQDRLVSALRTQASRDAATIEAQKDELRAIYAELDDSNREMNEMSASHKQQLASWVRTQRAPIRFLEFVGF